MSTPRNPLTAHLLDDVARAWVDLVHAQRRLARAVKAAREFGCTWVAIGKHAGHSETWARRYAKEAES